MLTHDRSNMEKAMALTYSELVNIRKKSTEARWRRKDYLIISAGNLVAEYIDSLSLRLNEQDKKPVSVGVLDDGVFKEKPLARLDLDNNHAITFHVRTDFSSDDIDRYGVAVRITMWLEGGYLYVEAGDLSVQILTINKGEPPGCYGDVIAVMKDNILKSFDKFMPK